MKLQNNNKIFNIFKQYIKLIFGSDINRGISTDKYIFEIKNENIRKAFIEFNKIFKNKNIDNIISRYKLINKSKNLIELNDTLLKEFNKISINKLIFYSLFNAIYQFDLFAEKSKINSLVNIINELKYNSKNNDNSYYNDEIVKELVKLLNGNIFINESELFKIWRLEKLQNSNKSNNYNYDIKYEEYFDLVLFQVNALYTLPVLNLTEKKFRKIALNIIENDMEKISNFDHPVPIFVEDKYHELIWFLKKFDKDIELEKRILKINKNKKIKLLISVSFTHHKLESIAKNWIIEKIKSLKLKNLNIYIIFEEDIKRLKMIFNINDYHNITVNGNYSNHFNVLKYFQLLFERVFNVKKGFKLDTDEAIETKLIFEKTGKSFLQNMIHNYWGNNLILKFLNKEFYSGIIAAEYINSSDIEKYGYLNAFYISDVKFDKRNLKREVVFPKQYVHSFSTSVYNKIRGMKTIFSHPVLKGGGYGIDNYSIKNYLPFVLSSLKRAEDQGFYIDAFSKGVISIFTPELRIAHYKDLVKHQEQKTLASRFDGDLNRIFIFSFYKNRLKDRRMVKYFWPMPGIFFSDFPFTVSLFWLLNVAIEKDFDDNTICFLLKNILMYNDNYLKNKYNNQYTIEENNWNEFVERIFKTERKVLKNYLESINIKI